jgi:hypothetical protein
MQLRIANLLIGLVMEIKVQNCVCILSLESGICATIANYSTSQSLPPGSHYKTAKKIYKKDERQK